jgi:hypothetical protein
MGAKLVRPLGAGLSCIHFWKEGGVRKVFSLIWGRGSGKLHCWVGLAMGRKGSKHQIVCKVRGAAGQALKPGCPVHCIALALTSCVTLGSLCLSFLIAELG